MRHNPSTSPHYQITISVFAALLDIQPSSTEPRPNPALGSILGRCVGQPYLRPQQILLYHWLSDVCKRLTFDYNTPSDITDCASLIWNPTFTPPRFSTAYLERVRTILLERDIKVQRLQQSLTTIEKAFLAKQDEEVRRNPSRRVIPRHYFSQQPYAGHFYPIIGPHQIVPLVSLVSCSINDSTIRALYKSTFHTIRKLTRGSRSLAKGNVYE
jgi:hypothetical protein